MKTLFVCSLILLLLTGCDYEVTSSPSESELSQVSVDDLSKASLNKRAPASTCVTIPDGELYTSDDRLILPGYDDWGYNYQAHMFNGLYCDSDRKADLCEYKDVKLSMKWNDAWLSNKDCDSDGKLDRHLGYDSYIGSGAWVTNHQSGEYEDEGGDIIKWNYFVKIVAVPTDASADGGIWYTADGTEIGPDIWGEFAIIQQISNDPGLNEHGVFYQSPVGPGFGKF